MFHNQFMHIDYIICLPVLCLFFRVCTCCSHNPPGCVGNIPMFFWLVGAPFLSTNPHVCCWIIFTQLSSVQNVTAVWLYGIRVSFIHWGLSWIAAIHKLGNPCHQLAPRNDIPGFEHCSNQWQSLEYHNVYGFYMFIYEASYIYIYISYYVYIYIYRYICIIYIYISIYVSHEYPGPFPPMRPGPKSPQPFATLPRSSWSSSSWRRAVAWWKRRTALCGWPFSVFVWLRKLDIRYKFVYYMCWICNIYIYIYVYIHVICIYIYII